MKLIDLVTSESEGIHLNNKSGISYNTEGGAVVDIDNTSHLLHPLCVAEVFNRLSKRHWHLTNGKFLGPSGELSLIPESLSPSPDSLEVDHRTGTCTKRDGIGTVSLITNDSYPSFDSDLERINELYMNLVKDVNLYNTYRLEVNLDRGSITVDLIEKDNYTNTVSLIGVEKKFIKYRLQGKVDLTVTYTKGSSKYVKDLTFEAFKYVGTSLNPVLERMNFINSMNNADVLVEYIDGVVRVIPGSDEVSECIISNCLVTYGHIEEN
jgi:hypothetical protein